MLSTTLGKLNTIHCVILGGGGHAQVLVDCLHATGKVGLYGILDTDPALWGKELLDVPILGGDKLLPELLRQGTTHFIVGLGGTGDNEPRRRLFELGLAHGLRPLTVIHPSAICSPWAKIGEGCVLYPTTVVNAGAILGKNVIVNTGTIVEHDCVLGDHVHVATGARLASSVRIGDLAHIGAGATIKQCICVGEGAVVGAGAVVVNDVRPHTVVVGVPARPMKIAENGQKPLVSRRR